MQNNLAEKEEELEVIAEEAEETEAPQEESQEATETEDEPEAKEDELGQYSESVQRRISKLTSKFREEERQRQAAIEYAEAVQKQNQELRARVEKLDSSYVGEFGNRIESDAIAAKEAYRKAYDTSDEYYTELDRRVRTEFPHKFQETKREAAPRVASAEATASKSSSPKGRRTVKLTPSQIAIAKRLNVPLEEYAKYVKE